MGQEILYCYKCQTRLLGSEFEKGKAFKVGGQASCPTCVKDLLATVPDAAYESDRGRKLASTARIPIPEPASSSKIKAITNRSVAPPPPAKPRTALIAGVLVVVAALVLLGIVLSSNSSSRRSEPPPPPPAPDSARPPSPRSPDQTPAPAPAPVGFAGELRDIDEKIRTAATGEDCKAVAALLDEARKRRTSPEWLSEVDLRLGQVVGRARRASLPLRDGAVDAFKRKDDAAVKAAKDRVASWGFPAVVDDFDKALAEAAAPPPPPTPAPTPAPSLAPVAAPDPNAPPIVIFNDALGPGVMNHSWSAVVNLACTSKVYSGTRSISARVTKAWGAIYLHFDKPIDPDRYPYVAFSLLVTEESIVSMTLWGLPKKSALLGFDKLGGYPKFGEWRRYVLPVAPFNVEGRTVYSIVFQAGKVTPEPLLYVDDIVFLPTAEDKTAASPAASPEASRWTAAAVKAAARDYEAAQKEMEDAADAELVKLAAQVPSEAAKVIEKWAKGQKVRLEYAGPGGERTAVEGAVVNADAVRVTIARDDGPVEIPVAELVPSTLAELFRARPDRKPQDARAAAAFCAFEGDAEGARKLSGDGGALPDKYYAFAQSHSAVSEAEAAARRTFWAAEAEFAFPKRRAAAVEKYLSLQSSPELARLRPYLAARLEAAKDTIFILEDLTAAGTFSPAGNPKIDAYWCSTADSPAAKARENYVEAEFYAFAGAPTRAWVWVGGCCQETFDASWQGSDLTAPNPKNPKEPLSCEPGAEASLTLKIAASLRKWHAQHGGPKEPARWEWVSLPLPKYETAGPKKIRILTAQQGFSVAAVYVSATKRDPPRDVEMKELEKARMASRRAGGNEPPGSILHELWWNINGSNVDDLIKSPAFQGKPSVTSLKDIFEGPRDIGEAYGTRMRGFVHPPLTGAYTFWIASDDEGQLFLSSDDTTIKKKLIANCPPAAGFRDWNRWPSCKSAPVVLTAGKRYYVEALHKEGGGSDHLSVGWTLPDGTEERPIPGKRLSPWSNLTTVSAVAAPAAPAGLTFYRAIALNSPATIIDGRRWEGKGAPDVSTPEGFDNQNVPLTPPVADAAKAAMIRSSAFARGSTWVKLEKVPAGTYQVFLYIWEDNDPQTMDLFVQGKEVLKGYNSGAAGHWDRLGPWTALVTNGTLQIHSTGGDANFSGIEVWKSGR
jgi:hypothetical protein